jgi:hypothetical protein
MYSPVLVVPEWVHDDESPNARRRLKVVRRVVLAVQVVGWLIMASAVVVSALWITSRIPHLEAGFVDPENLVVIAMWLILLGAVVQTLREVAVWVLDQLVRRSLRQFVDWGHIVKVTPEVANLYRQYRENDGPRDEELLFRLQRDYNTFLRSQKEMLDKLIP